MDWRPDSHRSVRVPARAVLLWAGLIGIGAAGCGPLRPAEPLDSFRAERVVAEILEASADSAAAPDLKPMEGFERRFLEELGRNGRPTAEDLHRLADRYLLLENRQYREQLARYNQQLRARQAGHDVTPLAPKIDHGRSRTVYERLLALYPDRSENDRVLYHLAHVYDDLAEDDLTLSALRRLVDRHPKSPLREEAVFRMAELYFALGAFDQARAAYRSVRNSGRAEFSDRALYKLGWTAMSQQRPEEAVGWFRQLLDRKRVPGPDGRPRLDPRAVSAAEWDQTLEVLRSMAAGFAAFGPPDAIRNYFDRTGHRDYEKWVYRKLGEQFTALKRPRDAVRVYAAFIETHPLEEEALSLQMEIIETYQRLKLYDPANRARMDLVDRFAEGSAWYRAASPEARERARGLLQPRVAELARFFHAEAQQTRRPRDYEKALAWYRKYLRDYPREWDTDRIHFLLAECLYELKRYPEAAAEYEKVAYDYPLHADSATAGFAAVASIEKILAQTPPSAKGTLWARLADDAARFGRGFPADPRSPELLWKAAETYARLSKRAEARAAAEAIVRGTLPTDDAAAAAQRLIGGTYFDERRFDQAAAAYRQAARAGAKWAQDGELRRMWSAALYKQAETLKTAGRLREAQTEFMRVQAEVPGSEAAPAALFDAGVVALQRFRPEEAVQLFKILMQKYPDHRLNAGIPETLLQWERAFLGEGRLTEARVLADRIKTLESPGKGDLAYRSQRLIADRHFQQKAYEQAAAAYQALVAEEAARLNQDREELVRLWASSRFKQAEGLRNDGRLPEARAVFLGIPREIPESEVAPVALMEAGRTALLQTDPAGALQAFSSLVQAYPASGFAVPAALQSAEIYERLGRLPEAAGQYEAVLRGTPDPKTAGDALLNAARLYEQLSEWGKAEAAYRNYLANYPGEYPAIVEANYKAARAILRQGRPDEAVELLHPILLRSRGDSPAVAAAAPYMALAGLLAGDAVLPRFDAVALVAPLEKSLAEKKRLLEQVVDYYARAAEARLAGTTTEATQKIGRVFEKFRTALLESERPADLTPAQLEQYNFLLEEQVYPFEEKAIAAYESNVRRTQRTGLYDDWIRQSYADLARLLPGRYRKPELPEVVHPEMIARP